MNFRGAVLTASILIASHGAPATVCAQVDSTWRQHEAAVQAAIKRDDIADYRAHSQATYRLVGATPRLAFRLAMSSLRLKDSVEASRWFRTYAAMGLTLDSAFEAQYRDLLGVRTLDSLRSTRSRTRSTALIEHAFTLPDVDMIAEDLAYDTARHRYLVSSVHHGGIVAVDSQGHTTTFVPADRDRFWGIFALHIDERHGSLWATTAAMPQSARWTPADSGHTALLEFDLATGALRRRIDPVDAGLHAFGDLTVASDGTVFVSDGTGSGVYQLRPGDSALSTLVPAGLMRSPQTPALSADGRTLFVADYTLGIAVVDLRSRAVTWMRHADDLALSGIDGLYRVGDDLIAIQNGLEPNRIMRLHLEAAMRRVLTATPLVFSSPLRDPTHAVLVGSRLYFIGNSGWARMTDDGVMSPGVPADAVVVWSMKVVP